MLVELQGPAAAELIEFVCEAGKTAGLTPTVFGGEPTMVLLAGTPLVDVRSIIETQPGVVRIVDPVDHDAPITSNLRIRGIRPLIPPAILTEQLPLPAEGAVLVQQSRRQISNILDGKDDRLVVVVGPCSIHDAEAAPTTPAAGVSAQTWQRLRIVLRVYFEKPRNHGG